MWPKDGVSFSLDAGRVLGVLGESGSGKTVTLRALIGLLPHNSRVEGRITVAGHEITGMSEAELREVRGTRIAMIFQEPMTALDVTVQIQIIVLLRQLQQELGMAVVFVTHDVGVAAEVADRVAVMYAGRFVETGPTEKVIGWPTHSYTAGLLASTVLGAARGQRLEAIPGSPPDMTALPPGCTFAPRCRFAEPCCRKTIPPEFAIASDRAVRCLRTAAGEIELPAPSFAERDVRTGGLL